GIRGFPGIQGGAEKRCEELFTRLTQFGLDITVFARKNYFSRNKRLSEWKKIKFLYLASPKIKGIEAFVHSFLSTLVCLIKRPDIVHYQNMGPAFFVPLVKIFGIRSVVTFDSVNYLHQKWNKFAKLVLKLGEFFAVKFADRVIVVSDTIKEFIEEKYDRKDLIVIPNGINIQEFVSPGGTLKKYNLEPKKYILCVARFVPEKGLHDLINAYKKIGNPNFKLVIVGDADIETDYSRKIKTTAKNINGIVLTGILTGKDLNEIYSNAGLFVLPSYYEGLPIALLEALSYGLPVLVSDIPQHKEIPLPQFRYFPCGDVEKLKEKIVELYCKGISQEEKEFILEYLKENYNWDKSVKKVLEVYNSLLNKKV
ncbi:MAG: glycosyltransferase family 4 protein, partial [Candidatus Omnitrophica bacterium]|nr:glycosyltransferase family 4 protein [Candidatus Omnitrophota bacterium]